jgi:signal transduction histidine kinase
VSNIAQNAARYAGGLTAATLEADGDGVAIHLDDAGPGIPPDERRAVLQRFTRGRAGKLAGTTSGTGLGLALATGHIELHGGSIAIGESPDGGARFTIRLPAGAVP